MSGRVHCVEESFLRRGFSCFFANASSNGTDLAWLAETETRLAVVLARSSG